MSKDGRKWQITFEKGLLNGWAQLAENGVVTDGNYKEWKLVGPYIVKEDAQSYVIQEHPEPTNGFLIEV